MTTTSEAFAIAMQHHQAGRLPIAEQIYRQILQAEPNHVDSIHLLGVIAHQSGNHDAAIEYIGRAIQMNGNSSPFHSNLGEVYRALRRIPESIVCYRRALELNSGDAVAHNNLGTALIAQGKLGEATACFRQAIELRPNYAEAHSNLGNVLKDQGRADEAVPFFRQALQWKSDFIPAHSNLLLTLQYCEGASLAGLFAAHSEFHQLYAASLLGGNSPNVAVREPRERLRVGFVSADFSRHPVGTFLIPLFEHLPRNSLELFCYSDRLTKDDVTERLQASATQWHDVTSLDDERLAQQIRTDQIDILFDLAGHTAHNRLLVFARKPAAVQITWLGYVGTTGLQAMDYILADRHLIPPEAERFYCEKVLRMPDDYVCYHAPEDAPSPGPLSALERGYVTFGSLNNLSKITPNVISIWAEILHRVAGSRLVIRHRGLDEAQTRQQLIDAFSKLGILPDRLDLVGFSPFDTRMDLYNQIDLGLDPFPYSGATTTCDALWMGVPVITCPFETFASRQSMTHLLALGLEELIARDLKDYVGRAVALAEDLPRLANLKAGLRERMAASPLCDGKRFATHFAALLKGVWESTRSC